MSSEADWVESMPEIYDRCLGPALFAPWAERVAQTAAAVAARTPGPSRILELAAGTGIATAALIAAIPDADITATDLNPAMVSWSAPRITGATWRTADAQHLDFPDAGFDLVVCQFGAMFFPDKPAAFAEASRVLAPGARMVFAVWDTADTTDFAAALVASLSVVLPEDPPTFVVRVPHGYSDPDRIRRDLAAGAMAVDQVERVVLRGASPSAAALAEGYCLGTPLRFALEGRGSLDVLTAAVAEQMTARLGEGPVTGDLAGYLVTAGPAT